MAGEGLGGAPTLPACLEEHVVVLLRYEREQPDQRLTEALLKARSGDDPPSVRDAADRLLRSCAPWALDLSGAAEALVEAAGDERSRRLFVAWSLRPDVWSQTELAAEEGVSAQRVGQIVQLAGRSVRDTLGRTGGPLRWAVSTLRDRLGAVTTDDALAKSLASLGAGNSPARELLRWLAGPYLAVPRRPGWLAVEPRQLVSRTASVLAADGGVRLLADVTADLADVGVRPDQLVAWLATSGAVVVHDVAVFVEGPLPDAVERILDAYGTSRRAEEVAADLAGGGRTVDEQTLVALLRGRRFAGTPEAIRLAAWGPGQRRRPAKTKRRRPARSPTGSSGPGCFAADARTGRATSAERLWLWVKIDTETLRGSEGDVPIALVEGLGLEPPSRRTFSSRWGPVTLAFEGTHPARGSVRAVALAAGARVGDTLLLGFSVAGDLEVELRPAAADGIEAGLGQIVFTAVANGGTR